MPTAIYIAGLGQSTNKESVEKYPDRAYFQSVITMILPNINS